MVDQGSPHQSAISIVPKYNVISHKYNRFPIQSCAGIEPSSEGCSGAGVQYLILVCFLFQSVFSKRVRIIMAEANFTVYVVDDDESVLTSLKMLIESSGYPVVTFKSAEDFLHSSFRESPGCLILDIHLPGMSGFDLQKRLVKSRTLIPVIFITGHDRPRMEDEAMRVGGIAYLRKPFEEQVLLDAIQLVREKAG
jgi:CheY-like chemotaxis protein